MVWGDVIFHGVGYTSLDTNSYDSISDTITFVEVIEERQSLKITCLKALLFVMGRLLRT